MATQQDGVSVAFTRIFSSSPLLAACCFSRRSLSWEQIWKKQLTGQTTAPPVADGRAAATSDPGRIIPAMWVRTQCRLFEGIPGPVTPKQRSPARFLCSAAARFCCRFRQVFLDRVKFGSVAKYVVFLIPSVLPLAKRREPDCCVTSLL